MQFEHLTINSFILGLVFGGAIMLLLKDILHSKWFKRFMEPDDEDNH